MKTLKPRTMGPTTKLIQNLQRFRLITFDITDTLLTFKNPPAIQYSKTAAAYGYNNLDQNKLNQSFRKEFKSLMKEFPNYGKSSPNMDWYQWWIQVVLNTFKSCESGIPEKDVLIIAKDLIRIYRTDVGWVVLKGAREIVDVAKETGKEIGVISNFDPSLPQILKAMNFNDFDFILTAYDCGILKPNKEIFDLALAKCKSGANCEQSLHIGNLYDLDYVGARCAGWSSILISKMAEEELQAKKGLNRHHVFRSLPDLLSTLKHKTIEW